MTQTLKWRKLGPRNDCDYAVPGEPNPKLPYGYVEPGVSGGWVTSIWHPKRRDWFGIVGMPFKTRTAARRAVEAICARILAGEKMKPVLGEVRDG